MGDNVLFTCFNCGVGFANGDVQRAHYKTDWHRYNLKRKVAGMDPVSAEGFRNRVLSQQAEQKAAEAAKEEISMCVACGKKFNSANAFQNHINSKKHKEMVAKGGKKNSNAASRSVSKTASSTDTTDDLQQDLAAVSLDKASSNSVSGKNSNSDTNSHDNKLNGSHNSKIISSNKSDVAKEAQSNKKPVDLLAEDEEEEEDDSDIEYVDEFDSPLGLEDCIFCTADFPTFEANLKHMTEAHSFFVPDVEYLTDLEGLIAYLQEKVAVYFECLLCNGKGKGFASLESVRKHMVDKGHCSIDYSENGVLELEEYYDFSSSYPDWDEVEEGDASQELAIHRKHGIEADDTGFELTLKNGQRVGHRSLRLFYKQRYAPEDTRESVVTQRIMSQYKAIGTGEEVTPLDAKSKRDRARHARNQQQKSQQQGVRNNKMQHHFRYQILV